MANNSDSLSTVLSALADPTRRGIVELLAQGPASVSELARPFDMTLPSVLKHLGVLEGAGLISTRKDGRVKRCQLHREALTESARWMQRHRAAWTTRLEALDTHLEKS